MYLFIKCGKMWSTLFVCNLLLLFLFLLLFTVLFVYQFSTNIAYKYWTLVYVWFKYDSVKHQLPIVEFYFDKNLTFFRDNVGENIINDVNIAFFHLCDYHWINRSTTASIYWPYLQVVELVCVHKIYVTRCGVCLHGEYVTRCGVCMHGVYM